MTSITLNKITHSLIRSLCLISVAIFLTGCSHLQHAASEMLINLQSTYVHIVDLIMSIAYFSGAMFVVKGIFAFKIYGEQRTMMSAQVSVRTPVAYFTVGICLLFLPHVISIMSNSIFMQPDIVLKYGGGEDMASEVQSSVFNLIKIMGLIAVVRALFIASVPQPPGGGGGQGGLGKAAMHFFGGLAALNVEYMVEMIKNAT
jgi:hypothetical protein